MSLEDIELDNLNRVERQLIKTHGELSNSLTNNLNKIREDLELFEIDEILLNRVNDVLNGVLEEPDMKTVEENVKHLVDTFWHQMGED